jgi:hypothetical protein
MSEREAVAADDAFPAARAGIDAFAERVFSLRGTLRLHRRAIGGDLLRAPVNVLLAPVHVALRLLAALCGGLRLRRAASWLGDGEILLPTAVARNLEARLLGELFGIEAEPGQGVAAAMAMSARLRPVLREAADERDLALRVLRAAASLRSWSGTRSAVAEITTIALVMGLGAAFFSTFTPGVLTMAPSVAEAVARDTAITSFPLGETLGGAWYSVFPPGPSGLETAGTALGLVLLASIVTAFAGVVADPVQLRLGIHRRRLLRLIDAIESDLCGATPRPFSAREHYYARAADLVDIAAAVLRHVR